MYLRTPFLLSAVGYALRADEHKNETGNTGCWYWLPVLSIEMTNFQFIKQDKQML